MINDETHQRQCHTVGISMAHLVSLFPRLILVLVAHTLIIATEALSSASEFSCFLLLKHELLKPRISGEAWSIRTDKNSQTPLLSFKERCTLLNATLIKLHFFLPLLVYLWCFSVSLKKKKFRYSKLC